MYQEDGKSHPCSDIYYIHRVCSKQPHQAAVYGVPAITLPPLITISATTVKILNASMIIFLKVSFEPSET